MKLVQLIKEIRVDQPSIESLRNRVWVMLLANNEFQEYASEFYEEDYFDVDDVNNMESQSSAVDEYADEYFWFTEDKASIDAKLTDKPDSPIKQLVQNDPEFDDGNDFKIPTFILVYAGYEWSITLEW